MITDNSDTSMIDPEMENLRVTMSIGGLIAGVASFILYLIAIGCVTWVIDTILLSLKAR